MVLRGTRLNYNAADLNAYKNDLLKYTLIMTEEVRRRVERLFNTKTAQAFFVEDDDGDIAAKAAILVQALKDKYYALFNRTAPTQAEEMLRRALRSSKSALHTSLKELSGGLSLKTGVVTEGMETISAAIINENVGLIKSIPVEFLSKINTAVMSSITTGNGLADLVPEIRKYSTQSDRKVQLLAWDQTRKAYNTLNRQRMQRLGINDFEWIHSRGGQHARKSHIAMNGKIFSFDDLPIINQEQVDRGYAAPERGIPGQTYNCGCVMKPVLKFGN